MITHALIGLGLLILVESAAVTSLLWINDNKDADSCTPSALFWGFMKIFLAVTAIALLVLILISAVVIAIGIISEYFPQLREVL